MQAGNPSPFRLDLWALRYATEEEEAETFETIYQEIRPFLGPGLGMSFADVMDRTQPELLAMVRVERRFRRSR